MTQTVLGDFCVFIGEILVLLLGTFGYYLQAFHLQLTDKSVSTYLCTLDVALRCMRSIALRCRANITLRYIARIALRYTGIDANGPCSIHYCDTSPHVESLWKVWHVSFKTHTGPVFIPLKLDPAL